MPTESQRWSVNTLAGLAWTYVNMVSMDRDQAATSVLRAFQQKWNNDLPLLTSLASEATAAFPINRLTVDGRYGRNTRRAIVTIGGFTLPSSAFSWLGAFPESYDGFVIGALWPEIQRTLPVGSPRDDASVMWAMIRATIGEEANAGNAALAMAGTMQARGTYGYATSVPGSSPGDYVSPVDAAVQSVMSSTTAEQALLEGDSAYVGPGEYSFENVVLDNKRQRSTSNFGIWIALGVMGAVGVVVVSAARKN